MSSTSNLKHSNDSANYLRLQFFIIRCGTIVLRSVFDSFVPPIKLGTFLTDNKPLLRRFRFNYIANSQWDKMYPANSFTLSSETYDISLLKFLLRNLCLDENADAFKYGKLTPNDLSKEADVQRVGNYRNKFAHDEKGSLSKEDLDNNWEDLEEVLCRLGSSISTLKADIAKMKTYSIDPEMEERLREDIVYLNSIDRETQRNVIDVGKRVEALTTKMEYIEKGQDKIINKLSKGTPRFNNLRMCTKYQLEELDTGHNFIKTEQYEAAKKILDEKHIVVIIGNPGEGKTMMAKQLLVACSDRDQCLILSQLSDWQIVDAEEVKSIVIDDIFGVQMNSINSKLIEIWSIYLEEIQMMATDGKLNVILTTRNTVLQKIIKSLSKLYLFKEENVVKLDSKLAEKRDILDSHMEHNNRVGADDLIDQCVKAWTYPFGFPKCADMFAKIDELFEKRADFFAQPFELFLDCLHHMEQNETAHFLALVLLWANLGVQKKVDDLIEDNKAEEVFNKFGLDHKFETVTKMRFFLGQADNGFTQLDEMSGIVTFNHIVISDGVGIVAGKSNINACLYYSTKEFLMKYITVQNTHKDSRHCVYVPPYNHNMLVSELVQILNQQDTKTPANTFLDILNHAAFRTKPFVETFVGRLNDTFTEHLFTETVSTTEKLSAFPGIILKEMPVHVAAYCANSDQTLPFKELVQQGILKCMGSKLADEFYLSLLYAVTNRNIDIVDCLIDNGCDISEEALVIAFHTNYFLFEKMATKVTKQLINKCTFKEGKNLMCLAIQWGKETLAKHIAPFVDLSYRYTNGDSAQYHALMRHKEADTAIVFQTLIENGAPLDYTYGKCKQTLLHIAVELYFNSIINLLLEHRARVDIQDLSGQCPIHYAAFQNNVQIAELLLRHDLHNAGLRLTKHASRFNGMTFMHVSLLRKNKDFIKDLVPIIKDILKTFNYSDHCGRTVLYCAVINGESELVKQLLPISDVNKAEEEGLTPLHAAVLIGHGEIARELCFAGAKVNATSKSGKTPLHVAAERNDTEMITFLMENGAEHNTRTHLNETALHIQEQTEQKDGKSVEASILVLKDFDSKYRTELEESSSSATSKTTGGQSHFVEEIEENVLVAMLPIGAATGERITTPMENVERLLERQNELLEQMLNQQQMINNSLLQIQATHIFENL